MLVKRYHVKDMQQAMDIIVKELGSDAVILNSRKVRQKGLRNLFKKRVLEVMVAYDPDKIPLTKAQSAAYAAQRQIPERRPEEAPAFNELGAPGGMRPPVFNSARPPVSGDRLVTVPQGAQQGAPAAAAMPAPAFGGAQQPMFAAASMQAPGGVQQPAPGGTPMSALGGTPMSALGGTPMSALGGTPMSALGGTPMSALKGLSSEQLDSLDNRITSIDEILNNFINRFSYVKRDITYDYSEDVMELVAMLIENQVDEELVHSLAKETDAILKKKQETNAAEVMEHLILEQLGPPEPITPKKFQQKIILFIGATGVGKTTSLVKLAADFSIRQKKKVGIINTDTYRIAAQEQLKTYADILGIPLSIVYQMEEMSEAVEQMADRDMIFIDTAGKRPGDQQHQEDIMMIIEKFKPEDVLLCVSASTSFSCIKEWVDTYSFVDSYKLIVTKLDETKYRGILLNLSWHTKKRLAYVTMGQNVPDDIETADTDSIVSQLLGDRRRPRRAEIRA